MDGGKLDTTGTGHNWHFRHFHLKFRFLKGGVKKWSKRACFFAGEPLDSDFRLFAALAGVACEKRESNYSKLHYLKLHFKIVDLCICISPPTLPTSSSSQHSRPSISFYYLIQCTVALQFSTILTLLATLLASGGNCTLRLQFGLRICQSFSNRICQSFSNLFRNGFFSLFSSLFFFFIVRRVFVFARRPLSRRFLDKFATTKNQCLKYGRRQPRLLAWYISALRDV